VRQSASEVADADAHAAVALGSNMRRSDGVAEVALGMFNRRDRSDMRAGRFRKVRRLLVQDLVHERDRDQSLADS
jgi:hypothetical protein